VKCVVTEQGFAPITEIMNPGKRARLIIDRCAHPHFRPLLHEYLEHSGPGFHEPRLTSMEDLQTWRRRYEECCASFSEAEGAGVAG
jgi:acetyl-CoA hydrolase